MYMPRPPKANPTLRSVEALAPLYKRERYDIAASFTYADWYLQLALRRFLFMTLGHANKAAFLYVSGITAQLLFKNPNYDLRNDPRTAYCIGGKVHELVNTDTKLPSHIRPVTFARFLEWSGLVDQEKSNELQKYNTGYVRTLKNTKNVMELAAEQNRIMPPPKWTTEPVSRHSSFNRLGIDLLEVNLSLPNKYLIDQFKGYCSTV